MCAHGCCWYGPTVSVMNAVAVWCIVSLSSIDQRSYFSSSPVSAGIGGSLGMSSSTQPGHPFAGRHSEYQRKVEKNNRISLVSHKPGIPDTVIQLTSGSKEGPIQSFLGKTHFTVTLENKYRPKPTIIFSLARCLAAALRRHSRCILTAAAVCLSNFSRTQWNDLQNTG